VDPQSECSTMMTPPTSKTTTTITRRSTSPPSRISQTHYRPTTSPTSMTSVTGSLAQEIRTFAEYSSVVRYHSAFLTHLGGQDDLLINGQRPASSPAVSTISVAFSPDSKTMASTHGDHSVKITTCGSGHLLETLIGHPRTPWTVKYHPIDPNIVASGCLGHQVRLWNWTTATCLHMIRLEHAIISLSFHPRGQVLAIANGPRLHFWSLEGLLDDSSRNGNATVDQQLSSTTPQVHPESDTSPQQQIPQQRRGALTEIDQRHMLRCVHFPPDGKSVIVGGVNQPVDRTSRRPSQMSFYLRLFDFDLDVARRPHDLSQTKDVHGKRRKIINNVSWPSLATFLHEKPSAFLLLLDHCSPRLLSLVRYSTMMVVLMFPPMARRFVVVRSTGYKMALIMPWTPCIRMVPMSLGAIAMIMSMTIAMTITLSPGSTMLPRQQTTQNFPMSSLPRRMWIHRQTQQIHPLDLATLHQCSILIYPHNQRRPVETFH
jgi:activator-of-BECN1-regulated-autophagy protein 1